MINYIEYLNLPTAIAIIVVALLVITQVVGEILEFKGKVVPEVMKFRKYFARKKQERETLQQVPTILSEVKKSLNEVNQHYSKDNITMRDNWIESVNAQLDHIKEIDKKLDKNNQDILSLLIDNKRDAIIGFAQVAADEKKLVTREQFNRVFKLHKEYEEMINANGLTNGEVDIAIRVIREAYEQHMKNRTFLEDIRGYDSI